MTIRKRLIAAGVATFLAGILLTFPARTAYMWFDSSHLRLSGISGTIWNGAATEGSVSGFYLQGLQWSFKPLSLFKAQLLYRVESDTAFGSFSADAGTSIGGDVVLRDLDSDFALQEFSDHFQLQGFEGALQVRIESLVLRSGVPVEAFGRIRLANLLARRISPTVIGDYQADFTSGAEGIIGTVEDVSGVLDIAGTIIIGSDRSYSFVGKISAAADAPRGLTDQLRMLGSPDQHGQREFRIEGQL
jgi:general secretion pathway protein N